MVVKLVSDALTEMLGSDAVELELGVTPPAVIMMVGLQGSGKTTTTAKIAKRLKEKGGKKILMASLDVNRPAAQEQLAVLGTQTDVQTLPVIAGQQPVEIARRALQAAKLQGFDVLMLDTAGRLHVDQALMDEMKAVADIARPAEILLVVDSLTGQDAVNVAQNFSEQVPLTGVVLTRMDGDARGGAALSMRAVTGKPIKFAGTGEKLDALEAFDPKRVAGRILGMGDVVGLVERAAEAIQAEDAERMTARLAQGKFDMNDLRAQLGQMRRMGGLGALAGMIPGMKKAQAAMASGAVDERDPAPHGRDDRVDDAEGARQARADQRQAQDPHRQGQRHDRAGREQADEDASRNVDGDEAHQEDGRAEGADGRCSAARAAWAAWAASGGPGDGGVGGARRRHGRGGGRPRPQ